MSSSLSREQIVALDKRHVWHPYTAMEEWIARGKPLVIERALGARLWDADGRMLLDGNSSWWVASLGHNHPRLVAALREQAERMCHVALAGITHEPAAAAAHDLAQVAPRGLSRVFFSDDGSTAVEVAAKMAVQYFAQSGQPSRRRLLALEGAYHGDTLGAVSLGGVPLFRQAFASITFDVLHVPSPAGEPGGADWAAAFEALERVVTAAGPEIAALFVEPMVQGAAGMRIYPAEYLRRARALCDAFGILLVADEVFTGYGRTGPMWACEHAGIAPDILCTAKGFSGGMLPMAATLATERVFAGFLGGRERTFFHGHSFTGNPLGAAVAREVLAVYREERVLARAVDKAARLGRLAAELGALVGAGRCRHLGMIVACDLGGAGYLGGVGWRVYDEALARGAICRPLGDTVYLSPPINIDDADLDRLCQILFDAVTAATATPA